MSDLPHLNRMIDLVGDEIGQVAADDLREAMQAGDPVVVLMDTIAILDSANIPLPDQAVDALIDLVESDWPA